MTISELKNALNSFKVVPCKMHHERVLLDAKTGAPVKSDIGLDEIFTRVQLCNIDLRTERLGCAHTVAQKTFNGLLETMAAQDVDIQSLQVQFNEVILKIYLLDHKKGDLEIEYARCLDSGTSLDEIQNRIDKSIQLHDSLISQLQEVKNNIIKRLDEIDDRTITDIKEEV
jgi:hypothetical protein